MFINRPVMSVNVARLKSNRLIFSVNAAVLNVWHAATKSDAAWLTEQQRLLLQAQSKQQTLATVYDVTLCFGLDFESSGESGALYCCMFVCCIIV